MSKGSLAQLSRELVQLADSVVPSTAIITGQTRDFSRSAGSGWVVDDRFLVTNHHVIDGTTAPLFARLPGCSRLAVTVRGTDPHTDLAVLELEDTVAPPLPIRDRPAELGELCFAFGSPFGEYPESMTMGVVSGLNRRLMSPGGRTIEGAIQTDAAINHGNSGGPLVDLTGALIGVNCQGRDDADNVGFAIPAPLVGAVASELIEYGSVERAALGVSLEIFDDEGLGFEGPRMTVTRINSDGAAGLEPGDVLMGLDGTQISNRAALFAMLNRSRADRDITLEVMRNGQSIPVTVRTGRLASGSSGQAQGLAARSQRGVTSR